MLKCYTATAVSSYVGRFCQFGRMRLFVQDPSDIQSKIKIHLKPLTPRDPDIKGQQINGAA